MLLVRLGIRPTWQAFVPLLNTYKLAEHHNDKVDSSLSATAKTLIAILVPFYGAYMAAQIKVKSGANFYSTFIGFWMPLPFGWLAW